MRASLTFKWSLTGLYEYRPLRDHLKVSEALIQAQPLQNYVQISYFLLIELRLDIL